MMKLKRCYPYGQEQDRKKLVNRMLIHLPPISTCTQILPFVKSSSRQVVLVLRNLGANGEALDLTRRSNSDRSSNH